MKTPKTLRRLTAWYGHFAEQAEGARIRAGRLGTAAAPGREVPELGSTAAPVGSQPLG